MAIARVMGIDAQRGRWLLVLVGFLMNMCLGAIYAFSVFRKPLEGLWAISAAQSGLPFMVFLATFAFVMPIAGSWMVKWGPKKTSMLGGLLVGMGWMGASFSPSIEVLAILYGIIGGAGVGITYGCPIAVTARWFPHKGGLPIGLTVMGFGISALVMAPIMNALIGAVGPLQAFLYLGIVFLVAVVLLSLPLSFPPTGWTSGLEPKPAKTTAPLGEIDISRGEMTKTTAFYALWSTYAIGCLAGLMAIGIASPFGTEVARLDATTAAFAVSLFAVFNGIGRPIFGMITDRTGPRYASMLSFALVLGASVALYFAGEGSSTVYFVAFSIFWLNLGGWLALAPTATRILFGMKYYSQNYGLVFTAYGVGAIVGTSASGTLRDITGTYLTVFPVVMALTVAGMIIAFLTLKPVKTRTP